MRPLNLDDSAVLVRKAALLLARRVSAPEEHKMQVGLKKPAQSLRRFLPVRSVSVLDCVDSSLFEKSDDGGYVEPPRRHRLALRSIAHVLFWDIRVVADDTNSIVNVCRRCRILVGWKWWT